MKMRMRMVMRMEGSIWVARSHCGVPKELLRGYIGHSKGLYRASRLYHHILQASSKLVPVLLQQTCRAGSNPINSISGISFQFSFAASLHSKARKENTAFA